MKYHFQNVTRYKSVLKDNILVSKHNLFTENNLSIQVHNNVNQMKCHSLYHWLKQHKEADKMFLWSLNIYLPLTSKSIISLSQITEKKIKNFVVAIFCSCCCCSVLLLPLFKLYGLCSVVAVIALINIRQCLVYIIEKTMQCICI